MKVIHIQNKIEQHCPLSLAYPWDNCGLLVGNSEQLVKKVLVCLDVNLQSVRQAIDFGADMIVSHHPILLGGTKRITRETVDGTILLSLIENHIALYSAHTNMDTAKNGINARLGTILGLADMSVLDAHTSDDTVGLGRIGTLKQPLSLVDFSEIVKEKLSANFVRVCGDLESTIQKVAVASGSCSEIIPLAIKNGCDAIVTGDMKYHNSMDFSQAGICIIDAGHFSTERLVVDIFKEILSELGSDLEICIARETDIFQLV